MDSFVFAFYVIPFLIISLLIVIVLLLFRWLRRKGYKKVALGFLLVIVSLILLCVYQSFYPPDSVITANFEYYSKLKFPESGKVLSKYVTSEDLRGRYFAVGLIEVSEIDFDSLFDKIDQQHDFVVDTVDGNVNELIDEQNQYFREITKGMDLSNTQGKRNIMKIARIDMMMVVFLSDRKTIIVTKDVPSSPSIIMNRKK